MGSTIRMHFLIFLLIFSYISIAEGGDNSQSFSKDYEFVTDQNYNARAYINGKDPNIRKNIEEMIKVMVQDSLPMTMETNDQKYDITTDVQGAVNEVILQIALHASKITQKIILQSGLKPNSTQAIHTELQHCAMIENQNRNKEAQELADKVSLLLNVTKELTNTISLNSKQRNESSAISVNKKTPPENDLGFGFSFDYESTTAKMPSLCDIKVPTSITTKHNSWKYKEIPEKDDLDIYMIKQTGCWYQAIKHEKQFDLWPVFSIGSLEWRVAVRTRQEAVITLRWDDISYSFFIGQNNNTVSSLRERSTQKTWEHSTPGLLSEDRYVPLYVKISDGKLIVGHECDPKPFITRDVPSKNEPQYHRSLKTLSPYGAKYLHGCPKGKGGIGFGNSRFN